MTEVLQKSSTGWSLVLDLAQDGTPEIQHRMVSCARPSTGWSLVLDLAQDGLLC